MNPSRQVLAIDPSLTNTGWAWFRNGELRSCGYIGPKIGSVATRVQDIAHAIPHKADLGDVVIVEVPRIYQRPKSKGDPNQLTPLWGIAGAIVGRFLCADPVFVEPSDWKGQVPKVAMFARIIKRLTPEELKAFNVGTSRKPADFTPPKEKARAGDALDAVGIGLYFLGRLDKQRPRQGTQQRPR